MSWKRVCDECGNQLDPEQPSWNIRVGTGIGDHGFPGELLSNRYYCITCIGKLASHRLGVVPKMEESTYAVQWASAINETYGADDYYWLLLRDDLEDAEDAETAVLRVLEKAAECLRNGIEATFTGAELDLVRHLMPAHEVHQSGAKRWVLDNYGRANDE